MNDADRAMDNLARLMMGSSSEPFSERVQQLAHSPRNVGELDAPDGLGYIRGTCGDSMWIYLKTAGGVITEASFLTDGCGATVACGSAVTELVKNTRCSRAVTVSEKDILDYLGDLPASHHHCAELTITALRKALAGITITDHHTK